MIRLLLLLILLGGGIIFYKFHYENSQKTTKDAEIHPVCERLQVLCHIEKDNIPGCESQMKEITKTIGTDRMQILVHCATQSQDCSQLSGCLAGTGVNFVSQWFKNFMKGFQGSLNGKN